ncbi:MAG: sigma-54-dependent Fis family transcriptional regulator [Candidatus Brocadiae bacterium]|nr:sigma-54-dependent Fis family transcriptional regulator [Candidatus Brocadiia bacterium]
MVSWNETKQSLCDLLDRISPMERALEFLVDLEKQWKKEGNPYLLRLWNAHRYHETLLHTLKAINSEREINTLLDLILSKAIELTGAERGFLLAEGYEIAKNFSGEGIYGDYKISLSVAQKVKREGNYLLSENALYDTNLAAAESVQEYHILSILCVPIALQKKRIGVIYLDNRLVRGSFKEDHVSLLLAFADQAAVAIENALLNQKILSQSQEVQVCNEELKQKVEHQSQELESARKQIKEFSKKYQYHNILARSAKMQQIFSTIDKIKNSDLAVLVQGESGTGKELVARAIHFSGQRKENPFLSENCGAIPESLFESELFGYEKGAFTGAQQSKKGLFEEAQGGTLFLDEIGELSLEMQKKLLRVLAEKKIRRVGSQQLFPIDVRIITATNRNLKQMVMDGQFREDLYYRLNAISIHIPPLRERREDIPILVDSFLKEAQEKDGIIRTIDQDAMGALLHYEWPGNIRQLRNEILRLCALCPNTLNARFLSEEVLSKKNPSSTNSKVRNLNDLLKDVEKQEILKALQVTGNNKSYAAKLLGISRFTLQRKMDKWGMI